MRIANERYFREHQELQGLIALFIRKILDERPDSILEFAGNFFDRAELRDVVTESIETEKLNEARN